MTDSGFTCKVCWTWLDCDTCLVMHFGQSHPDEWIIAHGEPFEQWLEVNFGGEVAHD